jgi:hypothetical protein
MRQIVYELDRVVRSSVVAASSTIRSSTGLLAFHCKDCNSSFGSNKTLKSHRRFCQAASGWPLDPVDTSLCQERDGGASSNTWPRSPTVDPRSLLQRFARMFVSAVPPTITTHPQLAREHVSKATQETREFFMFPELYHGLR